MALQRVCWYRNRATNDLRVVLLVHLQPVVREAKDLDALLAHNVLLHLSRYRQRVPIGKVHIVWHLQITADQASMYQHTIDNTDASELGSTL